MNPEDRIRDLGSRDNATPTEAEWLEFRSRGRRSVRNRRIAGAVGGVSLALAIVVGAIVLTNGSEQEPNTDVASSPTPSDNPSPDTSPSSDPEPADNEIRYSGMQQWFFEGEEMTVFHEDLTFEGKGGVRVPEIAEALIERLLMGPSGPLAETGVTTALPSDTELLDLEITDDIAHVTFGGAFPDETDVQQDGAYAQVVYTLTQLPTIKRVAIGWESGESGGVAQMPVSRERFHKLLPPIVVESPYPGETLPETEFVLTGIANVFEANVSWRILDADGNVVQEGFTTATCGTGCYGTFEETIKYKGAGDYAILEVFESSAEDGSQLHLVEIPLNFEK